MKVVQVSHPHKTIINLTLTTMKTTKRYNFSYNCMPISRGLFEMSVPDNWESEVVDGYYSWGGYRASEIEEVEED
jgi:hypothetical protein